MIRSPFLAASMALVFAVSPVTTMRAGWAQDVAAPDEEGAVSERVKSLEENQSQLQAILEERGIAEQRAAQLAKDIAIIRDDRASITAALIAAAKTEKKLSAEIETLEGQMEDLLQQESGLTDSLWERRKLLAEVLAALQRMGLNPPPAMLVTPEDALSSVRSSILLAAVVPDMRAETDVLVADLKQLASLRQTIESERQRLSDTVALQSEEQARLELLVEEKRKLEEAAAIALAAEQARFDKLAAEAGDLEQLIGNLEKEITDIREEAERQRLAAEKAAAEEEAKRLAEIEAAEKAKEIELAEAERRREEARKAVEAARKRAAELAAAPQFMAPSLPFTEQRGKMARPVSGTLLTAYGENDGLGNNASGDTIETRSNAIVTSPTDGTVLYAGPFRAYGNLLILDAGDGYHVVLAGMDRIDVSQGQFIVAGEPVGVMGSIRLASVTAAAAEKDNPTLYIEFRKNGKPIDPRPWWADPETGRT